MHSPSAVGPHAKVPPVPPPPACNPPGSLLIAVGYRLLLGHHFCCRYSLFLGVFTFNGVILCQYIGCCNVPGDPKVFAGKVGGRSWQIK